MFSGEAIAPLKAKTSAIFEQTKSEWMQVLRPIWFAGLLLAVAIAGAVLPFRGMVGPAIAILLIFPLTQHGARWRGLEMSRLTNLAPTSAIAQISTRIGAFVLLGLALCLPSFGRMIVTGNLTQLGDICGSWNRSSRSGVSVKSPHARSGCRPSDLTHIMVWVP